MPDVKRHHDRKTQNARIALSWPIALNARSSRSCAVMGLQVATLDSMHDEPMGAMPAAVISLTTDMSESSRSPLVGSFD
jgi:hypothetical protein